MSLNNVQLGPRLLADLYASVLIDAPATAVPEPQVPFLGGNKRNILVVSKSTEAFLPDGELQFLTSVLAACKLGLADIALVNFDRLAEKDFHPLVSFFNAQTVLLFNVEPLHFGLPINFPPFQIQEFDRRTYLYAPDLPRIEQDKGLKKDLWLALKNLFCL